MRHLLKFILAFEKDVETPFAQESVIRPSTQSFFHTQRKEIRDRSSITRSLSHIVFAIMTLFLAKYGLMIYRVLVKDHVSLEAELGQGITDDILLGTIMAFFLILIYASLVFSAEHKNESQTKLSEYKGA